MCCSQPAVLPTAGCEQHSVACHPMFWFDSISRYQVNIPPVDITNIMVILTKIILNFKQNY